MARDRTRGEEMQGSKGGEQEGDGKEGWEKSRTSFSNYRIRLCFSGKY